MMTNERRERGRRGAKLRGGLQVMSSVARMPAVLTNSNCIEEEEQRLLGRSSPRNPHLVLCVRAHIAPIEDTTMEWSPGLELVLALVSGTPAQIRRTPRLTSNRGAVPWNLGWLGGMQDYIDYADTRAS